MDNAKSIILRAGAKDQLVADFTALSETITMTGEAKYAERPTLENLAKFITAQSGGPNKDMALFELVHLIYGVRALCGAHDVTDFFLSPDKATPNTYRQRLKSGDDTAQVSAQTDCLHLSYDDKSFDIRYGRIPFLVALYEFLCSMEGFAYFSTCNDLISNLVNAPLSDKALRTCSNGLASHLRKYRIAHLTTAQADGKFVQVYKFLQDESEENQIILHDDSVLGFWCLHNQGKDYRGYRTVFDLFSDFAKAFDEAKLIEASHHAHQLGVDRDKDELDISSDDIDTSGHEDWENPIDIFNEDDMAEIRFFKKKSETDPIKALMNYGPDALRLPVAFLRYETFGQVQSGITNDLQVGRGKASVERRMTCEDVQSYEERVQECERILDHIKALQASSLHVLSENNDTVVAFPGDAKARAKNAFAKMNRKGFDDQAVQHSDVFKKATDSLIRMERQLDRYMGSLKTQQALAKFEDDQATFSKQFSHLYQEALS